MNTVIKKVLSSLGTSIVKAMSTTSGCWNTLLSFGFKNASKEKVNNHSALTVSGVYACIRNVSEDIGKLPLKLYKKEGDYRFEQTENPLADLLQYQPNPEMTAMSFRETLTAHAMGWGNGYAEIQRDINGTPIALWPLRPDRVQLQRDRATGKLYYKVSTENGQQSDIWAEDIFHLHGLGFDGLKGYNVVQYASQSIGSAIAMDKFAGAYFANGMHQSGNLEHPNNLSEEAQKRLKKQLDGDYGGADKSHQTLILEEGMKFESNTIDPKASQMIETRQFSVTEFCRWMRIPPHKVADLTKATFSNIEEQNIDYVQDGLLGWCIRWEQALRWKLLSEAEKDENLFFEHNLEGLLRGNTKARFEAYGKAWDKGILSINEIRSKENLNPIDGGDSHFIPLNVTRLEDIGKEDQFETTINDIANRLASKEIKALESRVKYASQDIEGFKEWLVEFYQKHDSHIANVIHPFCQSAFARVNIDFLSLKIIMLHAGNPEVVLEDRKGKHADYIANNLRSYYEN